MLVLRPPAATKVAPRTRERTGLHLPKVRALGRPSHRSRLLATERLRPQRGQAAGSGEHRRMVREGTKGSERRPSITPPARTRAPVAAHLDRRSELHRMA